MWRRLSRRTFGPRRPLVGPGQAGLALFTAVVVVGSIVLVVVVLRS